MASEINQHLISINDTVVGCGNNTQYSIVKGDPKTGTLMGGKRLINAPLNIIKEWPGRPKNIYTKDIHITWSIVEISKRNHPSRRETCALHSSLSPIQRICVSILSFSQRYHLGQKWQRNHLLHDAMLKRKPILPPCSPSHFKSNE